MFERLLLAANALRGDQQLSLRFSSYAINHGVYPKDIEEVDAYILTGSKNSVYDSLDWISNLQPFIQKLHAHKKKLVGICFGHQMVAHALGGRTEKSDKGWGIGVKETYFEAAAKNANFNAGSYRIIYSHQDQVSVAAPGSVILASNDFCPIAMTSIGDHILTFQGHPEFSIDFTRTVFEFRKMLYPEELYNAAIKSLDGEVDTLKIANWMIDFMAS
jgi:GMP synthase-like glutamine amidotransferase